MIPEFYTKSFFSVEEFEAESLVEFRVTDKFLPFVTLSYKFGNVVLTDTLTLKDELSFVFTKFNYRLLN